MESYRVDRAAALTATTTLFPVLDFRLALSQLTLDLFNTGAQHSDQRHTLLPRIPGSR